MRQFLNVLSKKFIHLIISYEKILFYLFILFHLIPLFIATPFQTLDGPSHLYNANIIRHFLFGDDDFYKDYFYLNPEPEPNWFGHLLLSVGLSFVPFYLAEKFLLTLYIILLPLSFRHLVKIINPHTPFFDFLIFPFIYSYPFYLGFFNFLLGIPFALFSIAYFISNYRHFKLRNFFIFFILLQTTYFCHIYTYLLTGLVVTIFLLWNYAYDKILNDKWDASFFKNVLYFVTAALPGILFSINFFAKKSDGTQAIFLSSSEITRWIKQIRPIIALDFSKESPYTSKIFYFLMALSLYILVVRLSQLRFSKKVKSITTSCRNCRIIHRHDVWLLISLVFLFLLYYLPDIYVNAGYISVRTCLIMFLMWILWAGSQNVHPYVGLLIVVFIVYVSFKLNSYYMAASYSLSKDVVELRSVSYHLRPNTTVLPVNFSDNWLQKHISNYLGADKKLVILDNYEAANYYFPVRWKEDMQPYSSIGGFLQKNPCFEIDRYEKETNGKIDYVLLWYKPENISDSCTLQTLNNIFEKYLKIFTSPNGKAILYRRK